MYKVLVMFTDLQDNGYKYLPGNEYPRKGLNPSPERIVELSTTANKRHIKLIESDGTDELPKKEEKAFEDMGDIVKEPLRVEDETPINVADAEPEEIKPDFMNPPEEPVEEPIEEAPKKRGRKKNAD